MSTNTAYCIGYDLGSSSIKIALVKADIGEKVLVINEPAVEMQISSPRKNWAEQNPDLWWKHICNGTKRIIKESGINAEYIKSIGIAYQMHGLVVVNKKGQSVRDSIIWCDSRAVDIGNQAWETIGKEKCMDHLLNSPSNFTASKLKWVQENEPEKYKEIHKFMLPGDYIALKMSNEFTTTKLGMSEGTLWDYKKNSVAKILLDHYKIDIDLVPEVFDNFVDQCVVSKEGAKQTGLPEGIPIRYRSGDQPNNAFSLNVLNHGEVAATGGTSGAIYAVTKNSKSQEGNRINNFAHVNYTTENPLIGKLLCINGTGIQYSWLKRNTGAVSFNEMNQKASEAPVGSDGLVALPFGNGAERIFNNKVVGSHFLNLDFNNHNQSHLYRAALEGIAFSFVYGMEILKQDNAVINIIKAGNDNLFRSEIFSQTLATLINHDIEIYDTTGAVGAARASGLEKNNLQKFKNNSTTIDRVKVYSPFQNKETYRVAYEKWLNELNLKLETI